MNLQVGVKVIIKNNDNQILLLERSAQFSNTTDSDKKWDIPGGRINPDESIQDALKREIREEIGHNLKGEAELIKAQDIFVPDKDLHVVRLTHILNEDIPEITLSEEHTNYKWVSLGETEKLGIDPFLKAVLDSFNY